MRWNMKKLIYMLSSFLITFNLSGCQNSNIKNKIGINQKEGIDKLIWVDERELIDFVSQKRNFILYVGQQGCQSCNQIIPTINQYISLTNRIIYWIEYSDYLSAEESLKNSDGFQLNPIISTGSAIIFNQGKISKILEYSTSFYTSVNNLKKEIDKYTYNSNYFNLNDLTETNYMDSYNMYKLSEETYTTLKNFIFDSNKITILYTLNICNDCNLLKSMFLDGYISKSKNKLYYFDVDKIRENEIDWITFKSLFQFDNYRDGRVPSIVSYQDGKKIQMSIFVNDVIEEQNGQYCVVESFYEKSIVGTTGKTYDECRLNAAKKEVEFIKIHLDDYL